MSQRGRRNARLAARSAPRGWSSLSHIVCLTLTLTLRVYWHRAAESAGEAECTAGCEVCASGVVIAQSHGAFALPAGHAFKGAAAKEVQVSKHLL